MVIVIVLEAITVTLDVNTTEMNGQNIIWLVLYDKKLAMNENIR